ncbi:MAG: cell division protein FtsH, partial [Pseudomonadota bacterium]
GGRVAEQLVYGKDHLNSGAAGDINQATSLAKSMVTEWGMSEKLGPLLYSSNSQEVFLGQAYSQSQVMSEATSKLVDEEVRRLVTEGYDRAWEILSEHRESLEAVTQALMEYETLTGDETAAIMRGEKIERPEDTDIPKGPIGSAVPTAGVPTRPRDEPDSGTGGMEPQPT